MAKKKSTIKEIALPDHVEKRAEELAVKHKAEVSVIEVDGKYAYLKKPDRKVLKMAATMADTKIDEAEILLENCWLEGDEEIQTNDDLFLSIMPRVLRLIEFKASRLKKFSGVQK